jgi:hypothetical protein
LVIEFSHRRLTGFFAPGVAGVDDRVDVVAREQALDHVHLLLRALVAHHELEMLGHDR